MTIKVILSYLDPYSVSFACIGKWKCACDLAVPFGWFLDFRLFFKVVLAVEQFLFQYFACFMVCHLRTFLLRSSPSIRPQSSCRPRWWASQSRRPTDPSYAGELPACRTDIFAGSNGYVCILCKTAGKMTPSLVTFAGDRYLRWISRYNYVTNTPGMFSRASMKAYNSLDAYIQV